MHEAYNILQRREPEGGHIPDGDGQPELAFVNAGGGQPRENTPRRNLDQVICYDCGEPGHIATNCPRRNEQADQQQGQGTNLCMHGSEESQDDDGNFSFSQSAVQPIPASWILLDNQSTVDLFCNSGLLKNIRKSNTRMNV